MEPYIIAIIVIASVFVLANGVLLFLIMKLAFKPRIRTATELSEEELNLKKVDPALYDIPFKDIWLDSDLGYKIYARGYLNDLSNKYVIIIHGHNSASSGTVRFMKIFYDRGYNVILPDNRYSAKTGGDFISFGHYEKFDIIKCIDYIYSVNKNAEIGIMGESMGGATALLTAGLRDDLKFCIDYCGYADMGIVMKDMIRKFFPPGVICMPLARLLVRLKYGYKISDVRPSESAKNIKCPLLILHSKTDRDVRYRNHKLILDNAKDAEHVAFENAPHGRSLTVYGELFTGSINKFLDRIGF